MPEDNIEHEIEIALLVSHLHLFHVSPCILH